jgi:hypothetical protein
MMDECWKFMIRGAVHEYQDKLWQRIGQLSDDRKSIEWLDPFGRSKQSYYYDNGKNPRVACNGGLAVQLHVSQKVQYQAIFRTPCYVFDRRNWMGENLKQLGTQNLTQIVLPASHETAHKGDGHVYLRLRENKRARPLSALSPFCA